jgi:ABC-type branched-subunit amino acid transport system ATPase component
MLELRKVSRREPGGGRLADVSAVLAAGERLNLVGLNPAGRRAVASLLAGKSLPDSGGISFGGKPLDSRVAKDSKIVIVPPEGVKSSGQTIASALRKAMGDRKAGDVRLRERLASFGLETRLSARVSDLATLERVRLGLALALARRPRLLVLDGAGASLSAPMRQQLLDDIDRVLAGEDTICLVLASDALHVGAPGWRSIVLVEGAVAQEGEAAEVRRQPARLDAARAVTAPALNTLRLTAGAGVFRMADGSTFLPAGLNLPPEGEIDLAVRPQALGLGRANPEAMRFAARYAGIKDVNGEAWADLIVGGEHWLAAPFADEPPVGAVVNLFAEPAELMAFDSSGARIHDAAPGG